MEGKTVKRNAWGLAFASGTVVLLLAGCGAKEEEPGSRPAESEARKPVTIRLAASGGLEKEILGYIGDAVSRKYPHITLQGINMSDQGQRLAELVAANQIPDIVANGVGNISGDFIPLQLAFDLSGLIEAHKFDTSRIDPIYFESIRVGSGIREPIGIPLWNQAFGLIYNPDLFDKFGVAYPKDGMTWEQVRDLAVTMTRSEGGVQYYGLWADNVFRGAYQLALPFADWSQNKALFQTNEWKELFAYWYDLYRIPGYPPKGTNMMNLFYEGRLAMMSGSTGTAQTLLARPQLNWDVVTYPTNPKAPGVGQRVNDFNLFIASTSENKDAAFEVISVALSDEVQLDLSRKLRMSSLKSDTIRQEFGKGIPELQTKNIIAFTKPKLAELQQFKNIAAHNFANNAFNAVLYDGKDINTALREADELMNKAIQAELNK